METYKFIEAVYKHYGHRAINSLYNKCMEILDTIEMGFKIRDFRDNIIEDFKLIGENLAQALRQSITKQVIKNFLQTKEVYQITSIPVERKSFNWMVVENKCIKWEMDSVYLGDYLKRLLGWEGKKKTKKVKEPETNQVIPNTHGIINQNGKLYVIYIHPHKEWTDTETPKIHWMNTEHNNWATARFKYTYWDDNDPNQDNNEVWKKDRKDYKRYKKITTDVKPQQILMSGFNLTSTNKLRANTKKEIAFMMKKTKKTAKKKPQKEPKEYSYLLTIIDVFSKYAWVFPLQTHSGVETAIILHELFTQKTPYQPSPYKPKLLLSDIGSELKNPHTNFVCKHNGVFQIYALPQRPLGIIERFNQTFKREMKKAIYEGRMTKYNFVEMIHRLTAEYNSTTHNTTQYKPAVAHFSTDPQVARHIYKRLQKIKEKNEVKYNTQAIIPLQVGDKVRVLSTKDPSLTSKERNEVIQAFTYKRFARPLWTKKIFTINQVLPNNYYLIQKYKKRFYQTELMKVTKI